MFSVNLLNRKIGQPGRRIILGLLFAGSFGLAACSGNWTTDYEEPLDPATSKGWRISAIAVSVPEDLSVSDNNSLAPNADIVWHGDPPGDRRAQVKAIVETAARSATRGLSGSTSAQLNIVVSEFHGVTPAAVARAPGAVHNITLTAQVTNARTNVPLTGPVQIRADLPALVGAAAFSTGEQLGEIQKSRVTAHITETLRGWLGVGPDNRGTFSSAGR